MWVYGETWKIMTSRHWHQVGGGKAFNVNLYQSTESGCKVWFADFKDRRDDGNIVTSYYHKLGLMEEMSMGEAVKKANTIALLGEAAYPD